MRHSIAENISINFFIRATTYLFSFLTMMYVTRVLQPAAFGITAFASSVAGYFVMLASMGMPLYATRECASSRSSRSELSKTFNELWSINILLAALSLAAFAILVVSVPKLRENSLMMALYGTGIIFQAIGCDWLYQGLEKFRFLAVATLICKVLSLALIVIFVRSQDDVILYVIFSLVTSYGTYLLCFFFLRRHIDISFRFNIRKKHFKPLVVFFMMSCAVYIYSSLDTTMLGFMKTDYDTGLYSIATRLKFILTLTGIVVLTSALPAASELWKKNEREQFRSLARKSMALVGGIQLAALVVCMAFSSLIIRITGGESFMEALPAFRILLLSLVPIGLSNIAGGLVLIPAGKEKRLLHAEIAGAVLNFAANLVFIPKFSFIAAAWATVASETLVCILCLRYVKKDLGIDLFRDTCAFIAEKTKKASDLASVYFWRLAGGKRLPYYCPCCNSHLHGFTEGEFMSSSGIYNIDRYKDTDQKVICPICASLPRHRIMVSWMGEHLDMLKDKRILVFAPEKSVCRWMKRHGVRYTTADLSAPADLKLDIQDTKLEDASYDVIICNHVLEHVENYGKALEELHRIISPDGFVIMSFPEDHSLETVYEDSTITTSEGRVNSFGQYDHLRVFGKDSASILESFGFDARQIKGSSFDKKIKPVTGPADYDLNILWIITPTK